MGQPPHIQKITPCDCGSTDVYWHGPREGPRVYCCDKCYEKRGTNATIANVAPVKVGE